MYHVSILYVQVSHFPIFHVPIYFYFVMCSTDIYAKTRIVTDAFAWVGIFGRNIKTHRVHSSSSTTNATEYAYPMQTHP